MNKEDLREAVQDAIRAELGQFFVEREKHYQHHMFIGDFIDTAQKIRGSACKAVTVGIVGAILTLLVLGFKSWVRDALAFLGVRI